MLKQSPTISTICAPSSYPASRKRYLQGNCGDLRVPYREIALPPTRHSDRIEETLRCRFMTLLVHTLTPMSGSTYLAGYPTFAPTGSNNATTPRFIRVPLPSMRQRERDLPTYHLRSPSSCISRRARGGRNVSQMHYVRNGIITPGENLSPSVNRCACMSR
jgi:phosphomethylpyrimidine synthase